MLEPIQVWRCRYCSRVYESRDDCIEHMKKGHVKCPYCGQFAWLDDTTEGMRCKQCGARQVMENGIMAWHPR
jgi:DNA-directed RNA polymerase subunit RPC12/RpoP